MSALKNRVSILALSVGLFGLAGAAAAQEAAVTEVIVTGTRTAGVKAADSAAPVEVVGADALKRVGQPDLIQSLSQNLPSFEAEALGGDTANLTLTARLRGLSPNDTLVLVDGKRRHTTANLHVLGGPYQGAASADLSLIPVAAIDHIEVLEDGAAAQYGSDAIAGVINIITKKKTAGGSVSITGGEYFEGDGPTGAWSATKGLSLGNGYLDITAEQRFHGFSQRGGADRRIYNEDGTLLAGSPYAGLALPDAPKVNHIVGDAQSLVSNLFVDSGYQLTENVEVYGTASASYRKAEAFENYRVPGKVIASPVLGVAGSYTAPGELIFAKDGFNPLEGLNESDYALGGGIKGEWSGWHWDLSTTWGKDVDTISTQDSANRALYIDTHFTPTYFHDGAFTAWQWTNNLDLTKDFDVGLASPLTLAFGGEARKESYAITAGDPASIYKEGGQSYPGFQPTDAGTHHRFSYAGYIDVAVSPIEHLKIDLAGRAEHYSDFGSTGNGKLTARYDFTPAIALRGTISNGFRAPTLAEEYYSATNVSPTAAVVQLPANSDAAKLLGFSNLKPEKSTNYSAGLVWRPVHKLFVTLDAYQIDIKDRIVGTGTIYGEGGANNAAAVLAAIKAHGNVLDPTVTYVGVSVFTNGLDTRTQGVELTATYASDFGDWGHVDWSAAANYNETTITHIAASPAPVLASTPHAQSLFSPTAISELTTASPKEKLVLGAYWTKSKWSVNLRETVYGPTSDQVSPNGGTYYAEKIGVTGITDLEVGYAITQQLKAAIGANNLFDTAPPNRPQNPTTHAPLDGSNVYDAPLGFSPFGINGGYYYGRLTYSF